VELRLFLHQDADGETRFAVDADLAAEKSVTIGPGARLIEAFARQLGAFVARDAARPLCLWVRVPSRPADAGSAPRPQQQAEQEAGAQ
jgi:hypothetical protein